MISTLEWWVAHEGGPLLVAIGRPALGSVEDAQNLNVLPRTRPGSWQVLHDRGPTSRR